MPPDPTMVLGPAEGGIAPWLPGWSAGLEEIADGRVRAAFCPIADFIGHKQEVKMVAGRNGFKA